MTSVLMRFMKKQSIFRPSESLNSPFLMCTAVFILSPESEVERYDRTLGREQYIWASDWQTSHAS